MFPKMGPLRKQTPISRALLSISFGVPSKEALPPGSSRRAPTEKDAASRALPHPSFQVPGKWAPFQVPQQGPYGERCPSSEPSFTYPSGSPVKEPPLQVPLTEGDTPFPELSFIHLSKSLANEPTSRFPSGAPMERDSRFQSFPLHNLHDTQ